MLIKETNGRKPVRRWYYIDICKALEYPLTEREDAIFGFSEDRIFRSNGNKSIDCSTPEQEYELGLFPLAKVFEYAEW